MDGAPAPSPPPLWQSLLLPVLLLVAGVGGLLVLKSRARPPAEVEVRRAPLRVPVLALERSEVVVTLTGHAALRPRRAGPVASELRARVRKVAEDLRPGAMVREGQVLVELDGDDSESALASARAELTAGKAGLERLEIERGRNESLVKVRREVFDLAEREWQRGQELRRGGSLISDSELGRLKLEALRAREGVLQLERALELHAPLCREQQARVEIFEQQVRRLERDLERTRIAAPFAGRIERAAAEVGRLALPGEPLFELADDSRLEAPVPLLAEEAERWLEADTSTGWYVLKRPHVARLKWVSGSLTAQGRLQGYVLSLLPIVLAFAINWINPELMRLLWVEPLGRVFIAVAVALWLLGFYMIRKIVSIDV